MKLTVENGCMKVKDIKLSSLVTSSILFIGDTKTIILKDWFEEPPDKTIVGVTPGFGGPEEQGEPIR